MGIASSLFTGVSGLNAFGTGLSVISNNIGGVSTVGFKGGDIAFGDIFAAASDGKQVGRGVSTQTIRTGMSQGSFESTGNSLDMAIDGIGFFSVKNADGQEFFSRAGAFGVDQNGFITTSDKFFLQGLQSDSAGKLTTTVGKLNVAATTSQPKATANGTFVENLDARDVPKTATTLNGTIDAAAVAATTLVGTGTSFTTQLVPGDTLLVGANKLTVASIQSNTSLTLTSAIPAAVATTASVAAAVGATTLSLASVAGLAVGDALSVSGQTLTIRSISGTTVTLNTATTIAIAAAAAVTKGGAITAGSAASVRNANFSTGITMFDSIGKGHLLSVLFSKAGDNAWDWNAVVDKNDATAGVSQTQAFGTLTFASTGALQTITSAGVATTAPVASFNFSGSVTQAQPVTLNFGTTTGTGTGLDGVTQFASVSAVLNQTQDGFAPGSLQGVSLDKSGIVSGLFTNGRTRTLGQVTLARFNNQEGLVHVGSNRFVESSTSGQALIGVPGAAGAGNVLSNSLELSNVDLAQQFTKMIEFQRGFQANSRVITTTDDLLVELVNLKR